MRTFLIACLLSSMSFAQSIAERLTEIEGISFQAIASVDPGYQTFEILLEQNEDHTQPDHKTFKQKLILHHVSFEAPMVLQTSGYQIFRIGLAEIAAKFRTNQIQVEHRFFDQSIAAHPDWSKLNIWQAATDFHRITQIFKQIYRGAWVNTGASKGGMTSVFHRRFYPEDLDATVAYVAPISYGTADPRYIDFLDRVGGESMAECRAKLISAQRGLLKHRDELVARLSGKYTQLSQASVAFEHAVYELPFAFWQYGNPFSTGLAGCESVPNEMSSPRELEAFLSVVNNVEDSYSDDGMSPFVPYYFQAAHQLGAPGNSTKAYDDLAIHQSTYDIKNYLGHLPVGEFEPQVMRQIQKWVLEKGRHMIFINGEYDPWSAAAYEVAPQRQQRSYSAPQANHGAKIVQLGSEDQSEAWQLLADWLRLPKQQLSKKNPAFTLEDAEFEARRRLR